MARTEISKGSKHPGTRIPGTQIFGASSFIVASFSYTLSGLQFTSNRNLILASTWDKTGNRRGRQGHGKGILLRLVCHRDPPIMDRFAFPYSHRAAVGIFGHALDSWNSPGGKKGNEALPGIRRAIAERQA